MRANCSKMRFRTVSARVPLIVLCARIVLVPLTVLNLQKTEKKVVKAKTKKIYGVEVGFHCKCVAPRIASFFAFIIQEILIGHRKK